MKVININDDNFKNVEEFLKKVESVKVDQDIIHNASLLMDNDEIIGIISFECFGKNGLIRYFIFTKIVDEDNLSMLFNNLIVNAKERNINKLFSFIYNKNTLPIFEYLGFFEIDKKNIYVEEKKFDIMNKSTYVYCYNVS